MLRTRPARMTRGALTCGERHRSRVCTPRSDARVGCGGLGGWSTGPQQPMWAPRRLVGQRRGAVGRSDRQSHRCDRAYPAHTRLLRPNRPAPSTRTPTITGPPARPRGIGGHHRARHTDRRRPRGPAGQWAHAQRYLRGRRLGTELARACRRGRTVEPPSATDAAHTPNGDIGKWMLRVR